MIITNKVLLEQFNSNHRVWQGIPGIVKTKNGRTFISFYSGGTYETYGNYAILLKSDTDSDFGELGSIFTIKRNNGEIIPFL